MATWQQKRFHSMWNKHFDNRSPVEPLQDVVDKFCFKHTCTGDYLSRCCVASALAKAIEERKNK